MAILARFERETGSIVGTWEGPPHLLEAQQLQEDAQYGTLLVPATSEQNVRVLQERYAVVDGVVMAKQALTIVAHPALFPADGTTPCQITVAPFVPCMLLVNGEQVPLSASDATLALTADAPQQFVVSLVTMAGRWAEPLTVEAR